MSAAVAGQPEVLHATPGRMRVHVPGWSGVRQRQLESDLARLAGVRRVQANPLTGNILVWYDAEVTDEQAVLAALREVARDERPDDLAATDEPAATRKAFTPHVVRDRRGHTIRARIAVPGLDQDPALACEVVRRLRAHEGVRVSASALTGRVLVEFIEHQAELDDLIAEIARLDLPDVPEGDHPAHPLDAGPVVQSVARTVGAAAGLTLLGIQRMLQAERPVRGNAPVYASALIGILQGIPFVRDGLRRLLGRDVADIALSLPNIVALALLDSPLGMALVGAESLRLLTEALERRAAWRRFEEQLARIPATEPGTMLRLEAGEKTPLAAVVVEGMGTALGPDGLPVLVSPGEQVPAGARLYGGPFTLELALDHAFEVDAQPAPKQPSLYERYVQSVGFLSLAYAGVTAVVMRSLSRTLAALLMVTPRTALIGQDAAELGAAARALRAGVTVVGSRPSRTLRRPDVVMLASPRVLADGLELAGLVPLEEGIEASDLLSRAATVAAAAGWPWGGALRVGDVRQAAEGSFDGHVASARVGDTRYALGPVADDDTIPAAVRLRHRGEYLLALWSEREAQPLGILVLRQRLARGANDLVETCRRQGVRLGVLASGNPVVARSVARRATITVFDEEDACDAIRVWQADGLSVAFVSDSAQAGRAFAQCDLAIALFDGHTQVAARADLVAPDLVAVAAVVEASGRRDAAVRDSVLLSAAANVFGAVWGLRGAPGVERASRAVYVTSLGALGASWLRLRGGEREGAKSMTLVDPRPERWGRRDVAEVLRMLTTSEQGLTTAQAAERRQLTLLPSRAHPLLDALGEQLRSPLTGILAAGAGLSLFFGSPANAAIIAATVVVNVAIDAWQVRHANEIAQALEQMGTSTARVVREGTEARVAAPEVVPGDIVLLAPGERVPADGRLITAAGLELDEASLTGESLPVPKAADAGTDAGRVVLEGSDVTAGTGRAVVVAVGSQTRMGATVAALSVEEMRHSPLGVRLSRMLREAVPISLGAGAIVLGSGLLRGEALAPLLGVGASIALAAVPEGLPLLSRMGEAAVAGRLASREALVRRLPVVEALGRVDVACADKTGTLTEGHLALRLVADLEQEATPDIALPSNLRRVLLAAAMASPHPESADATAHPTDVAVVSGALEVGLGDQLRGPREAETSFDPVRSFHATAAGGHVFVKGAPEALTPRCAWVRRGSHDTPLDESGRRELLTHARGLAERGLRVLLVAEGSPGTATRDPEELSAVGFVGIRDPLRPNVAAAVQRCREAGVRVIMITGDHPATARAIAREAGLLSEDGEILTGTDIAELSNGTLDMRLERAVVIARATPLDKLRIIESLRRRGHTVAMTGDGVNDAPALRLADAGVAMGRAGTEVARQTADVVILDDDFATLVEVFVEGRSFWRNIRRALGLLVGGNLGELGLIVGASVLGLAFPLTARQILVVNMVTDILPALAVALQQPEHRNLAALAREGTGALDRSLRADIWRRAGASALPSLAAYVIALSYEGLPAARTVAFASIVATQLAQTLDSGWSEGGLNGPVLGGVGGSLGMLAASVVVPRLRTFLGLALPTPIGWALVGAGAAAAVVLSRAMPAPGFDAIDFARLPARVRARLGGAQSLVNRVRLLPAPSFTT